MVVVLVDDGGYGMLRYDFTRTGEQPVGCDLATPDFVALAESFRVAARRVTVDELGGAIAAALAGGNPTLLVLEASYAPPLSTSPRWYRSSP